MQEIQEKKRGLTGFDFLSKSKFHHQKVTILYKMGSLYRVFPKVKYHYALKNALNKEGKSGKGENKVKKSTKEERDNSHKATTLHCAKIHTLVLIFAPWCEFSHPGANFRILVRNFLFCSSSIPLLLLLCSCFAPDF